MIFRVFDRWGELVFESTDHLLDGMEHLEEKADQMFMTFT